MATALELATISLEATHVATKELIEFRCPWNDATDTIGGIINFDEDKWTFDTLEIDLVGSCTKVKDGSEGLVGFIIAIVQGIILMVLGPAVAIYGPSFPRFTSFVQAMIVSSYVLVISSLVAIDAFSAFNVLERAITLMISTLTVTYASVNSPGVRAKAYGFALGSLIMTPLMLFVSELLYKNALNCDTFGKKTEFFPNGIPSDSTGVSCEHYSVSFQLVYQLTSAAKWIGIFLAASYGKKLLTFAVAVAGSTMVIKGGVDLVKAIGYEYYPDDALAWLTILTPVRTWATYGLAVLAFLAQKKLLQRNEEPLPADAPEGAEPKVTYTKAENQPAACTLMCSLVLKVCYNMDAFLLRNLENLKDGGKGALMRAATRKSTPKKEEGKGDAALNA